MSVTISGTNGIDKVQDGTIQSADFAAGVPARSNLPAGTVLQVVNATYATATSTTSGTLVSTGLSATITPTSSTSKILVVGSVNAVNTQATNTGVGVALYKTTVTNALAYGQYYAAYDTSSTDNQINVPFSYLDSPATTSATTYGFSFAKPTGSGSVYVQANNSTSFITLMEIAV